MSNHPVSRVLERDVIPYLVSGRQLTRQWFYRVHVTFGYTTDLVATFAALGVAVPILTLLGAVSNTGAEKPSTPSVTSALASLPAWAVWPAGLIVIIWVVLRVAFNREEGQKRAVLAKSCVRTLRVAEASLPGILGKPDPMPDITQLLEKQIRPSVDRSIQEEAWPWLPFADNIEQEVTSRVGVLCNQYQKDWALPPDPTLRQSS